MKDFKVNLSGVEDAKDFCRACEDLNFNLDVKSGKYVIDAKSLLGILSLKLSEPVTISVHSDYYDEAVKTLERFIIK